MDHTEKLETTSPLTSEERAQLIAQLKTDAVEVGQIFKDIRSSLERCFILTPDDILTLKLLRDEWRRERSSTNTNKRRDVELDRCLETLERILKQVG
jgi:hypothetical protein